VNGVHDMGGMHGFGPVRAEPGEPVFHAEWERRTFALTLAAGVRRWNIDMARFAREQMPPAEYLRATYYERWLWGLEKLLGERGLLTPDERRALGAPSQVARGDARPRAPLAAEALRAADVARFLRNRRAARRDDPVPATFRVGDAVRARNLNPAGHTRLPRYCRGHAGVIDRDHGVFVFPDTHAAGLGPKPQHVYSVRFDARELWGPEASAKDRVYVDLWDDYLEPA
jgi:nitrile hydratase subunit beta